MRVSYRWLKDYVALNVAPEKLARLLTMSGTEVTSLKKRGEDYIMDLEITSNRPDCLSVFGIAREIAALTGKKLKSPKRTFAASYAPKQNVNISIDDKKRCPRYTARIIRGVTVGPSARWLIERLKAMGVRPVNNIVDVTNFCLLETGEPMHAFDYEKLAGKRVIVRSARSEEKIVAIDGRTYELDESILVIADEEKPVAIAGIMGGRDTEVTTQTKNILLEAALFDPISIRRGSRKLGLASESSYRFERKIDSEIVADASDRAARLILEAAGGQAGPLVDMGRIRKEQKVIEVRYANVNKVLGVYNKPSAIRTMLARLGFKAKSGLPKTLKVIIPSFRGDIEKEIDLIEEVARLYGYQRIPVSIPKIVEQPVRISSPLRVERALREFLPALGLDEIITYSLLSRRLLSMASVAEDQLVEVRNPLSVEQEVMRPSLLPGMLHAILTNVNKGSKSLEFFEFGNVYTRSRNGVGYYETPRLGIAITGEKPARWQKDRLNFSFFDAKGILETVFERLAVGDVTFEQSALPFLAKESQASILIQGVPLGSIGRVADTVIKTFDIKQDVFAAEVCFAALMRFVRLERAYKKPPVYPSVMRDISLIIEKNVPHAAIAAIVKREGQGLIKDVAPFDQYMGKQIPSGKKGISYRIAYQDTARTLEDARVNAVHSAVCAALAREVGAAFR